MRDRGPKIQHECGPTRALDVGQVGLSTSSGRRARFLA